MFKGGFKTVRYLVSFSTAATISLLFLILYLMISENYIDMIKIVYAVYALILGYFSLFANDSINQKRHINTKSYLFMFIITAIVSGILGLTIAVNEELAILNSPLEVYLMTSIILSGITLIFLMIVSILILLKIDDNRKRKK